MGRRLKGGVSQKTCLCVLFNAFGSKAATGSACAVFCQQLPVFFLFVYALSGNNFFSFVSNSVLWISTETGFCFCTQEH